MLQSRRSAELFDFCGDAVAVFASIYGRVGNNVLRARIADILWELRKEHRLTNSNRFAEVALSAYLECPLSHDCWFDGLGRDMWMRVCVLAKSLGKAGQPFIERLNEKFLSAIRSRADTSKSLVRQVSSLYVDAALPREFAKPFIEALESHVQGLNPEVEILEVDDCYSVLLQLYKYIDDMGSHNKCLHRKAQVNQRVGEMWLCEGKDSGMICGRLEESVRYYDKLPAQYRSANGLDNAMLKARESFRIAQGRMCDSMRKISSGPIDMTSAILKSIQAVHGFDFPSALCHFIALHSVDVEDLRKLTVSVLQEHPLLAMFSAETFENRIVASRIGPGDVPTDDTDANDERLHYQMLRQYELRLQLVCKGAILPALDTLRKEHQPRLEDFIGIARQSKFVPENRRLMYARGLSAGWNGDYQTAVSLLIPQLENSVRILLKEVGSDTFHHEPQKVLDSELGLSTLLKQSGIAKVFNDGLVFELTALMGASPNFNLRNLYAHGFVDDCEAGTLLDVYVWWFVLKLVLIGAFDQPEKCGLKVVLPQSNPKPGD